MFRFGILFILALGGCQPHKKETSLSSRSFRDEITTYHLDSTGSQVAHKMSLTFVCVQVPASDSKRVELGYYLGTDDSKNYYSHFEAREVLTGNENRTTYKDLLIVEDLALSNLSQISLIVARESRILGTQMSITTLAAPGVPFLEYNRQTGVGVFSAIGEAETNSSLKCTNIRVP
jgi:hypothetical protein